MNQPRLLLLATLSAALVCPASARAMIAIDLLRPPLRAAAAEAARCPEIREGRHVVHLRIDGSGRGLDAEVVLAPEGTPPEASACIAAAFEAQRYPAMGSSTRRVGSIQVDFPFVVAPPPAPDPPGVLPPDHPTGDQP